MVFREVAVFAGWTLKKLKRGGKERRRRGRERKREEKRGKESKRQKTKGERTVFLKHECS